MPFLPQAPNTSPRYGETKFEGGGGEDVKSRVSSLVESLRRRAGRTPPAKLPAWRSDFEIFSSSSYNLTAISALSTFTALALHKGMNKEEIFEEGTGLRWVCETYMPLNKV